MLELMSSVRLAERYVSARPEPALRRPQAAARDRARVRRRPAARRLRRADLGARRLGAGGDPQPPRRAAGAASSVSYLFISHDLGVVRYVSDRIAVLYLGRLMELGPAEVVFDGPAPPLHRGAALGRADDRRRASASASGSRARSRARPTRRPAASSTRAARAGSGAICDEVEPPLVEVEAGPPDALPHPDRGAARAAGCEAPPQRPEAHGRLDAP